MKNKIFIYGSTIATIGVASALVIELIYVDMGIDIVSNAGDFLISAIISFTGFAIMAYSEWGMVDD